MAVWRMLVALAAIDPLIATWRSKGRSRKQATASTPIEVSSEALASRLRVQRTDLGSDELPQLGFGLDAWNGAVDHEGQAAFSVTIGLHAGNPGLRNSFVVDLPGAWVRDDSRLDDVAKALCTHLDPDEVVLFDNGRREVLWSRQ